MGILLYIVQAIFSLLTIGLLLEFKHSKRIGILLGALAYGLPAALSIYLVAWWPLGVGIVATWVLRFLGADPSTK